MEITKVTEIIIKIMMAIALHHNENYFINVVESVT